MLLVSGLSLMSVLSVVGSFVRRLRLPSTIARLYRMIRESLHRLFKLDVTLSSGKDLANIGDVVLQEVFVQGVSNLQHTDKCDGSNFLTTIGSFGESILKEVDI